MHRTKINPGTFEGSFSLEVHMYHVESFQGTCSSQWLKQNPWNQKANTMYEFVFQV